MSLRCDIFETSATCRCNPREGKIIIVWTRLHPQGRWPEVPILIGTANTALLPLKVPNFGSEHEKNENDQKVIIFWTRQYNFTTSESSKFWFHNWFRRLSKKSFSRRWRDKIGANVHSPLISAGQTTYRHMTHNDFWDLYTIGPSGNNLLLNSFSWQR